MITYIIRRILSMVPTLFISTILIFSMIHFIPGDPAAVILGDMATDTQVEMLREKMGLNEPYPVQYFKWITRALKGDLGESIFFYSPVLDVIKSRAETSIFVASFSMILIVLIGISIGVLSALKYNSFLDQAFMGLAMFGASVPTFWSGLIFMLIFAVYLGWLPTSGFPSVLNSGNLSNFRYLIMPCFTLAIPNSALIIRLTRSSMLDICKEDYVRTAKAKGLTASRVNIKHILRNALIPIVSALGFTFVGIISGAVVTESVFSLPGLGELIVQSILRRDYPVIQGIIIVVVLVYMIINLFVDILFAYLDPRIRYQ